MGMDSLVGYIFRHDQNLCPWWVFDNIEKILKKWAKILYSKKMNKWMILHFFRCVLDCFFDTYLIKAIKNDYPQILELFWDVKNGNMNFKKTLKTNSYKTVSQLKITVNRFSNIFGWWHNSRTEMYNQQFKCEIW